jgi:hypothetical protein
VLRARIAAGGDIESFRVTEIEQGEKFKQLRRRSLVLGASDGAHVDRLRRVSKLSHDQFLQTATPSVEQIAKLVDALPDDIAPASFGHVFFVDDFAGSGSTLIRPKKESSGYTGKVPRLMEDLRRAAAEGLIEEDVSGTIVLYCASEQAIEYIQVGLDTIGAAKWLVRPVQLVPARIKVDQRFPEFAALCHEFFDPTSDDEHKGKAPIGYADCALPLVLSHNAPNNSVCLLWMDTREEPESQNLRALFPRYERHHKDRQ